MFNIVTPSTREGEELHQMLTSEDQGKEEWTTMAPLKPNTISEGQQRVRPAQLRMSSRTWTAASRGEEINTGWFWRETREL